MKVSSLIEQLNKLNPDDEIIETVSSDPDGFGAFVGVGFKYKVIKLHKGFYTITCVKATYEKTLSEYMIKHNKKQNRRRNETK